MDINNKIKKNITLSPYTTFKIGGPADYFVKVKSEQELIAAICWAQRKGIDFFLLGGGSNILVADEGFSGLVIKNDFAQFTVLECNEDLKVQVSSGLSFSKFVEKLLAKGVDIVWKFAGIPASVGGAIFTNTHGKDVFIGDFLDGARVWQRGEICSVDRDWFSFGYDYSYLQEAGGVLLTATFSFPLSDNLEQVRESKAEWLLQRKEKFPKKPSAGCVFQNLTAEEVDELGLPTSSGGYFIDKVLELKGERRGGAKISERHANFIVNTGGATAEDVMALIDLVKSRAKEHRVSLQLEIGLVGMD